MLYIKDMEKALIKDKGILFNYHSDSEELSY